MKTIEYSIEWARGEQFEGWSITIFGALVLLLTLILWRYGSTPNAKALVVPALILGMLFLLMGSYMVYSNGVRQEAFTEAYEQDALAFLQAEKNRVEGFQFMYPASLLISAISFVVALALFYFSDSPARKALAIVLAVFGLSLLIIDYFSKERADNYYEALLNALL
mgnify:CR=1 FL=1